MSTDHGMAVRIDGPRFVGRESEVAIVEGLLATERALILIEGEPGIGKSRLVREAVLPRGDDQILVAYCQPFRDSPTLAPLVGAAVRHRPDVASLGLSPLAGALRSVLPEWNEFLPPPPPADSDPSVNRFHLLRAFGELLRRLKVRTLVVEDVHWADEATLEFLLLLVAWPETPIDLVVTYRRTELAADSTVFLLPESRAAGTEFRQIVLSAFDRRHTGEMIGSMLNDQMVSPELTEFLHVTTDGIPLAVEECVRLLGERGTLVTGKRGWTNGARVDAVVPITIRDAVRARVQRLRPETQRLLAVLAVVGEPISIRFLADVADLTVESVTTAVSEAIRAGLLSDDGRGLLAFRHVLMSKTVYDELPGPTLRRDHGAVAAALVAGGMTSNAVLARHFRGAGDEQAWSRYAEAAADDALAVGAPAAAASLLRDVLAHAALPAASVLRLLRKLPNRVHYGMADDTEMVATLRRALTESGLTPAETAALRWQLARVLLWSRHNDAATEEIELALSGLDDDPNALASAMMHLAFPSATMLPYEEIRAWLDRAEPIARSLPPEQRLPRLIDRAVALLDMGDRSGWAEAQSLPIVGSTPEARDHLARASMNFAELSLHWGRLDDYRRWRDDGRDRARTGGLEVWIEVADGLEVWFDLLTGRWKDLAGRAAAVADESSNDLIAIEMSTVRGILEWARGETAAASQRLRASLDNASRRRMLTFLWDPAATMVQLLVDEGEFEAALRTSDEPMTILHRKGIWWWGSDLVPARTDALLWLGRRAEAAELVGQFERRTRDLAVDAPLVSAAVLTAQAMLTEHDANAAGSQKPRRAAAEQWARTAQAWRELPRPFAAGRAEERRGRLLLAAGAQESGRELLVTTARQLAHLGATGASARIEEFLGPKNEVASPRTGRGGSVGYGGELSPRELAVVQLVMTGRTNAQIAHLVGRSHRTVAAQLNSAMRKMDVTTRTALAIAAARAGITPADEPKASPGHSSV